MVSSKWTDSKFTLDLYRYRIFCPFELANVLRLYSLLQLFHLWSGSNFMSRENARIKIIEVCCVIDFASLRTSRIISFGTNFDRIDFRYLEPPG